MNNLLEQIDAIKQKISDQEYRDMMDSLKTIHDEEKRYELTIAVMKNENSHFADEHTPRFKISIMRYIPTKFDTNSQRIDEYIKQTKENNGSMLEAVPLYIRFSTGVVKVDWDDYDVVMQGEDEGDVSENERVVEFHKHTLIAIREI